MNSRTEIIGFSMCVIVCMSFVLHGFVSSQSRYKAVEFTAGNGTGGVASFDTWTGEFKTVLRPHTSRSPPQIIDLQDLDESK